MAKTALQTAQQTAPKTIPPYLPYKTFNNTISGWTVALPQRIDRSILGNYSGAMQTWMMSSLRFFGLITGDGIPSDRLRHLVKATNEAERKGWLMDTVKQGYPFMFTPGFDLAKATPAQLHDKFKETGAQGETLSKCLSFFTAMAKDAGYELSPYLRMRQRRAGNARRPAKRSAVTTRAAVLPGSSRPVSRTALDVLIDLLDPAEMDEKEQQAVWTLIRYLKTKAGAS